MDEAISLARIANRLLRQAFDATAVTFFSIQTLRQVWVLLGKAEKMRVNTRGCRLCVPVHQFLATDFLQQAILTASSFIVVFLGACDLRLKKLCWSPLLAEMFGCSSTRTVPVAVFMVLYSFRSSFVRFPPVSGIVL